MDHGTSIRADHAAGGWSASGQLEIEMGKTETIYDWGCCDRSLLSIDTRVDGRDSEAILGGTEDGG